MAASVDSLAAAVALWTAVRPRTLDVATSGSTTRVARLGGLVAALAPHFQPLADAALATRDPDRCTALVLEDIRETIATRKQTLKQTLSKP